MKRTKKLTVSAMLVALGTVFMVLGAAFEVLDLTAVALASLLMVFAYIELGTPYTFLVWLGTSLLTFIFYPGHFLWLEYLLIFGFYPLAKGYIERLNRPFWLPLKLVYANLTFFLLNILSDLLIGISVFSDMSFFGLNKTAVYIIAGVLLNVAFIAYDIFINVMVRFYFDKLQRRFAKFLR